MSRIDDYEIQAKLGEGGMGAVFKARQVSLDRIVALKVLAPKLATDASFVSRFLREARATAKLNHPNIVAGIGVGSAGGYHYFAMEFIEGESLKKRLEANGCLPEAEVLRIGAAMASALAHAHAAGIVHRDVKPDNIMMARDGTPKLADLGLAKAENVEDASLTQAGTALGTPHYMAPEQAAGEGEIDGRADTYSLGCTLYHLATGHTPFQAKTSAAIMVKHLNDQMPHPRTLRPDLSDGFCLILSRMVARDREDRYADLNDAAADMEAVARGGAPSCRPLPAAKNKFQAAPAAALAGKGERMATRRHAPIAVAGAGEGAAEIRESRRRIAAPKPANRWIPAVAAGGGLIVLLLIVYALSGDSKSPADKLAAAAPAPNPIKPSVASNELRKPDAPPLPLPPAISPARPAPKPETRIQPQAPVAPAPAPPQPAVAPPPPSPASIPVKVTPVEPPKVVAETRPPAADAISLLGANLSDWKIVREHWELENGALVGRGDASNASIWKYGCLPADFELIFNAEDSAPGFHFGWMTGSTATICVQYDDDGHIRITSFLDPNSIELTRSATSIAHGKHAWRVVVRKSTVQVLIDNALAAEAKNVDQAVDKKRAICFFARGGGGVLRVSQLTYRDLANAQPSGVAPNASQTHENGGAQTPEATAEMKGQSDALAAYATFADEYLALLRKFDAKGAVALIDRAEKDAALTQLAAQVKQDRRLLALLDAAMAAELDGARKLADVDDFELAMGRGQPQHVGRKAPFHVSRVDKGAIVIESGGMSMQTSLTQLTPETRCKLAELGLPADGAAARAFLALLLVKAPGDSKGIAAAKAAVETARKNSAIAPDAECLDRWVRLAEEGAQNAAAAAAWPKIKALAEQQQWKALRSSLGDFARNYAKTGFFETKRAEFEYLLKASLDAEDTVAPPDEQLKRLSAKLKNANPDFDGQLIPKIENGRIVELQASPKGLKDLSPFRSVPGLKSLILNGDGTTSSIADLNGLKGMPLTTLELSYSLVKDLTPLSGMPLTQLNIFSAPVTDLSPLKGMPLLSLTIAGTLATDLSPLRGAPLKVLECHGSRAGLSDLSPLKDLPLEYLSCGWNAITDLTPLQKLPLKDLRTEEIKTDDLSPLKSLKLIVLSLSYKPVHEALLREMTTLEQINGLPAAEFRTRAANGTLPK